MTKKHRRNRLEENNVERFAWVFLSAMCILFLFPMVVAVMISISSYGRKSRTASRVGDPGIQNVCRTHGKVVSDGLDP